MPILQVDSLHKSFAGTTALAGVAFTVDEGEFFVLLGPSAAGKTTTLRAIAGLEQVQSGRIIFAGQDVTQAPVQGRPIAMIFQTFALYPHLSIRDNLGYGLREAGIARGERNRRIDEIAEMLRISHTLARKPNTLSGGEQQRVAIGRALIRRPKLLLLDEPLTNLDAKLRHDTRAEFKRLHRDLGMTMLYATPDQLEALSMGDRIGVIDHGQIIQTDAPDRLYDQPDNVLVGQLVGAPAMNLIAGARDQDSQGAAAVRLPFMDCRHGPWAQALQDFAPGEALLLGVRPQDLLPEREPGKHPSFAAVVHLTEPLGDITVLDLKVQEQQLKMVLREEEAAGYQVGDAVQVAMRVENTSLFAQDTGIAIR